jgi:protoporphyrinogen IX oxidase
MTDVLLAMHLIGLMMGAGGGFGSMITMRAASKLSPENAATLRALGPAMARFSTYGLVLMLLTGPALVSLKFGGFANMPELFWVKLVFVATLTIAAIAIEFTYGQVRRGDVKAAARLPLLGPVAGLSSILAVVFAVFAFH